MNKLTKTKEDNTMDFYIAEEGIPLTIGCEDTTIAYYGSEIELHYETKSSNGKLIFSAKLPILNVELPFWIFGEQLIFLDAYYLLTEIVDKNTQIPITSTLINIHTGKYAKLDHYYPHITIDEEAKLQTDDGNILILRDIDNLKWINIE